MESASSLFTQWSVMITALALGGVAIWGIIDKQLRDRRKDALDASDSLVNTLQKTINELKTKVDLMEEEQETLIKQMLELKTINETLTKILQGRDETSLIYQKELLAVAKETNTNVKSLLNK
jgi:tRNA U34 5-carboxymethylaminomethyl modifying GTPase MnmE/TrmE